MCITPRINGTMDWVSGVMSLITVLSGVNGGDTTVLEVARQAVCACWQSLALTRRPCNMQPSQIACIAAYVDMHARHSSTAQHAPVHPPDCDHQNLRYELARSKPAPVFSAPGSRCAGKRARENETHSIDAMVYTTFQSLFDYN